MMKKGLKDYWLGVPPWIIVGAVVILAPIFVYWTADTIQRQKDHTIHLLLEKGAALIRSFEAGARTGMMGMMGMHGGTFKLQRLLVETARQPDIVSLIVTDVDGHILAHSDPDRIGGTYGRTMNLKDIARSQELHWREVSEEGYGKAFEVFRGFLPVQRSFPGHRSGMMHGRGRPPLAERPDAAPQAEQIIFVGFDIGTFEAARREFIQHTVMMAVILLLIGFAGMVSLFLAQAYRSTRSSLTRIKAFSDNVVENMPIGLLATDAKGAIASFNQTAESILHVKSRDVLGKKTHDVLPERMACLIGELDSEKQVIEKDVDCPLDGGKKIPVQVSVSALQGDEGRFMGHIVLFRDLSEVQELKKEVERTQRLASIGRLAAGVAHEIRNPLSSIKGFATYFKERYRDVPEDQTTADVMIHEVDRLNRVIGQLLEFARPLAVEKKPVRLKTVIEHALRMVQSQADFRGIRIEKVIPVSTIKIPMDADRMNQVFLNLCLNAVEAMQEGGTLSVHLVEDTVAGKIRVTVSDTGAGIKGEDLVHVFDPYYTTKQSGTGLGLAIVHKIVQSHDGEVMIESEPGKGTRVTVSLPVNTDS